MSEKARDGQGRWRSKTIAFRISPEENDLLEEFVRLSGLTKQEYVINRVLERQITVIPNPRVHKALRDKMEQLCIQPEKSNGCWEKSVMVWNPKDNLIYFWYYPQNTWKRDRVKRIYGNILISILRSLK